MVQESLANLSQQAVAPAVQEPALPATATHPGDCRSRAQLREPLRCMYAGHRQVTSGLEGFGKDKGLEQGDGAPQVQQCHHRVPIEPHVDHIWACR